jgi:hypothetical protein
MKLFPRICDDDAFQGCFVTMLFLGMIIGVRATVDRLSLHQDLVPHKSQPRLVTPCDPPSMLGNVNV